MAGTIALNQAFEQKGREGNSRSEQRVREYTRRYVIQTAALTNESAILFTPGLPRRWSEHPDDKPAVCINRRPIQDASNPLIWYVLCDYSTDYILDDFDDPVFKLPECEWEFEDRQVVCPGQVATTSDSDGKPHTYVKGVLNSAGQPFDPPPLYDRSDAVLIVDRVENDPGFPQVGGVPIFTTSNALLYSNSLNQDAFLGAEPKTIRCKIRAKRFQWRDVFRWQVNYRFAYRKEGWQPQTLDQGTYHFDNSSSNPDGSPRTDKTIKIPFTDGEGNVIVQNLNGEGLKLAEDEEPKFITSAAYWVVNFAPLKIKEALDTKPMLNPN